MSAVIALAAGGRVVGVERARMAIVFLVDVCHSECCDAKGGEISRFWLRFEALAEISGF